mmetsp:Transcript_7561/g.21455  ORF Transcript_7561/g.21455 Transcript_7561/m.21455 type:complete len:213 (+) Transcript_7561:587-1225(+)
MLSLRACSTQSPGTSWAPWCSSCRAARWVRSGLVSQLRLKGLATTSAGLPASAAPDRLQGMAPAWRSTSEKVAFQGPSPARWTCHPSRQQRRPEARPWLSTWRCRLLAEAPRAASCSQAGVTTLQPAASPYRYLKVVFGSSLSFGSSVTTMTSGALLHLDATEDGMGTLSSSRAPSRRTASAAERRAVELRPVMRKEAAWGPSPPRPLPLGS